MRLLLSTHTEFIAVAYAAVVVTLGALVAWLLLDGRRQQRHLDRLDAEGIRRRSAGSGRASGGGDTDGSGKP